MTEINLDRLGYLVEVVVGDPQSGQVTLTKLCPNRRSAKSWRRRVEAAASNCVVSRIQGPKIELGEADTDLDADRWYWDGELS